MRRPRRRTRVNDVARSRAPTSTPTRVATPPGTTAFEIPSTTGVCIVLYRCCRYLHLVGAASSVAGAGRRRGEPVLLRESFATDLRPPRRRDAGRAAGWREAEAAAARVRRRGRRRRRPWRQSDAARLREGASWAVECEARLSAEAPTPSPREIRRRAVTRAAMMPSTTARAGASGSSGAPPRRRRRRRVPPPPVRRRRSAPPPRGGWLPGKPCGASRRARAVAAGARRRCDAPRRRWAPAARRRRTQGRHRRRARAPAFDRLHEARRCTAPRLRARPHPSPSSPR